MYYFADRTELESWKSQSTIEYVAKQQEFAFTKITRGGGRTRLPKFNFFGNISHRFTCDF